jgi:hypothetical protein
MGFRLRPSIDERAAADRREEGRNLAFAAPHASAGPMAGACLSFRDFIPTVRMEGRRDGVDLRR